LNLHQIHNVRKWLLTSIKNYVNCRWSWIKRLKPNLWVRVVEVSIHYICNFMNVYNQNSVLAVISCMPKYIFHILNPTSNYRFVLCKFYGRRPWEYTSVVKRFNILHNECMNNIPKSDVSNLNRNMSHICLKLKLVRSKIGELYHYNAQNNWNDVYS
jgi:hypothetical protein